MDECMKQVFLVDQGREEWVESRFLRRLDSSFSSLRHQAVLCCLLGVEPKAECWGLEATALLQNLMGRSQVTAKLHSSQHGQGPLGVELVLAVDGGRVSLATELVKKGLAREVRRGEGSELNVPSMYFPG